LTQIDITLRVIEALDCLQIPSMVTGSLAAAIYGVSRSTQDADLVADLRPGDGARIAAELGGDFYLDADSAEEAIVRRTAFSVIYSPEVFKVDLFPVGGRPYDWQAFGRRTWKPFGLEPPRSAFIESPEDLVLSKLRWYRLGGEVSDQQWRDILGVLKVQAGALDLDYLHRWAGEETVLDLLDRALREAGGRPPDDRRR